MIATCHYSMIITNWGDPVTNNDKSTFFSKSWTTFWIKIIFQWVSIFVYLLSQIMGKLCPERFE